MIAVYEIKKSGYLGATKQIDPREGVTANWTYTAPPADGPHRWLGGRWEPCDAEPAVSIHPINMDQAAAEVRGQRDALLAACDWTQVTDAPVDQTAWAAYRQALRDVPEQSGFPLQVEWPAPPN